MGKRTVASRVRDTLHQPSPPQTRVKGRKRKASAQTIEPSESSFRVDPEPVAAPTHVQGKNKGKRKPLKEKTENLEATCDNVAEGNGQREGKSGGMMRGNRGQEASRTKGEKLADQGQPTPPNTPPSGQQHKRLHLSSGYYSLSSPMSGASESKGDDSPPPLSPTASSVTLHSLLAEPDPNITANFQDICQVRKTV